MPSIPPAQLRDRITTGTTTRRCAITAQPSGDTLPAQVKLRMRPEDAPTEGAWATVGPYTGWVWSVSPWAQRGATTRHTEVVVLVASQTVQILTAPAHLDPTGTAYPQRDWDNTTTTAVAGCVVVPISATEGTAVDEYTTTTTMRLILPPGDTTITSNDRVTWDNRTWLVDGQPTRRQAGDGTIHHVEVTLVRAPIQVGSGGTDPATVIREQLTSTTSRTWSPR